MGFAANSKIYAQAIVHETFSEIVDFAQAQGNLEVATFAFSNVYDTDWPAVLQKQKQKLAGFKGKISLHGVFQDLIIHSRDKEIAQIAKQRIADNLKVASELGATQVVFHGNFNPFIKDEGYRKNWIEKNTDFWLQMLESYNGTILIENCWESTPQVFRNLLDSVNSPRLKICFDIGHAHVYSKIPVKEWFVTLGRDIPYVHMSDNAGEIDQHMELGKGNIDWQEFSSLIEKQEINPEIVLELVTLEQTKQSIRYLKEKGVYPFQ